MDSSPAHRPDSGQVPQQFAGLTGSIPLDTGTTSKPVKVGDDQQKSCGSSHQTAHDNPYTGSVAARTESHQTPVSQSFSSHT